jgi:hypothetical protein
MTTLTKTTKRSGQLVNNQHVEGLLSEYKKKRWMHNSEELGRMDSLSSWYGLEELSSFLELAREHQADGVKMYFGVYPDTHTDTPEYIGMQTVVLVATKKKQTEYGTVNKNIYMHKNGESRILAFNLSELCPPLCGTKPPGNDEYIGIDMEKAGLTIIEHKGEIKII